MTIFNKNSVDLIINNIALIVDSEKRMKFIRFIFDINENISIKIYINVCFNHYYFILYFLI